MLAKPLPPALTPQEWDAKASEFEMITFGPRLVSILTDCGGRNIAATVAGDSLWQLIAMANAALDDADPRKITRARLALLRHAEREAMDNTPIQERTDLARFLAALESYLPPLRT